MKVLQIASVFPVKDSPNENPYVRNYIKNYNYKYPDTFAVLKPDTRLPGIITYFSNKKKYWLKKRKICKVGYYKERGLSVFILPYYSIGSVSWMHSFFSSFIFSFNRKRLKELVNDHIDIVHAHYLFPDGLLAYQISRRFNKPFILTLRQEVRFFNNWYSRRWIKKIIDQATVLTTQSPQMAEAVNNFGIKKVRTLPTGIEAYFFDDAIKQKKRYIDKTQNDNNIKLKLLSVCNLLPIKNLESVLIAMSRMVEKNQISYSIFGSGDILNKLKQLTKGLNLEQIVHFKGEADNEDLPSIMPDYDVFIQPSFKETFGLTYFEAMACGLPVILTKNTGAYEMIKNEDVYYLVDPHNPDSVITTLREILNDRETLDRKAILAPEVARIASWDTFIDFFHEKYEVVTNRT